MTATTQPKQQQSQGLNQQGQKPLQAGQNTQKTDFRPEAKGHNDMSGSSCSTNKVK